MSGCRSQPEPRARRCNMIRSRPRQLGSAGLGSARPQRGRAAARWVSGGGGGRGRGLGRRADGRSAVPRAALARLLAPRGRSLARSPALGAGDGDGGGGGGGPAFLPGGVGMGGGSARVRIAAEATLASEMRWLFNP